MKRILLVDDEMIQARLYALRLRKLGYSVDVAGGGEEAVGFVQGGLTYDLILMDVNMPFMDGFETGKRISGINERSAKIPIIAFTNYTKNEIADRLENSCIVGLLKKPCGANELRSAVLKYAC